MAKGKKRFRNAESSERKLNCGSLLGETNFRGLWNAKTAFCDCVFLSLCPTTESKGINTSFPVCAFVSVSKTTHEPLEEF